MEQSPIPNPMDSLISKRLERMEDKIDQLVEITAQLSRIEERSSNQQNALERIGRRLDNLEERLEETEKNMNLAIGGKKALVWFGGIMIGVLGWISGQ